MPTVCSCGSIFKDFVLPQHYKSINHVRRSGDETDIDVIVKKVVENYYSNTSLESEKVYYRKKIMSICNASFVNYIIITYSKDTSEGILVAYVDRCSRMWTFKKEDGKIIIVNL